MERPILNFVIRRLLLAIPTALLASLIVYMSIRAIPVDVLDIIVQDAMQAGGAPPGEDALEQIRHRLGLDQPVHIQYARWLAGLLRGDMGRTLITGVDVTPMVLKTVPVSMQLGLMAMIISLTIALPVGIYAGIRPDTKIDLLLRSMAILFVTVPSFWLGTMILLYPSIWWRWSPPTFHVGFFENPVENLGIMIIPAALLGMWMSGMTMRLTRTMMLEVLRQDYVRTAWSKGLRERVVVLRHALKNALIPVVTMIGLQMPVMIGGGVVLEFLFNLPGMGGLIFFALERREYPVISGVNIIVVAFVLWVNIVVDISYAWLDPRIRYK